MSFARDVSDKIVFVDHGEILQEGTYEDLNNSSTYRIKQFLNLIN